MKARGFCLRLPALIINNLNDEQQKIWDDKIHVIEYSAYEKLQARHKKLLEAFKYYSSENKSKYFIDGTINESIADEAIEADRLASEDQNESEKK